MQNPQRNFLNLIFLILATLKYTLHDFGLHIFLKLQAQNHTLHKNHTCTKSKSIKIFAL